MSNVKVTSLEQVTQMAAVVALATEQKDEISQNSQVWTSIMIYNLTCNIEVCLQLGINMYSKQ